MRSWIRYKLLPYKFSSFLPQTLNTPLKQERKGRSPCARTFTLYLVDFSGRSDRAGLDTLQRSVLPL